MSPMALLVLQIDIILSKADGFTMFSMLMSVCQQNILKVMSLFGTFRCIGLAQHISPKITSKRRFHFIGSATCI